MEQVNLLAGALIALVVLLFVAWYTMTNKIDDLQAELNQIKEQAQWAAQRIEETEASLVSGKDSIETKEAPVLQDPSASEQTEKIVPAADDSSQKTTPAPVVDKVETIPPETIAVIMAAISAMGYSPASIRNIRPTRRKQRSVKWVMIGRIANMR